MSRFPTTDELALEARRVEKVYSVLARVYDEFFDWALGPGRRRMVNRLKIEPGDRVLEVGVGTGLSLPLYPRHAHVTGIDISEPMLDRARQRLEGLDHTDVDLRVMDAHDLAFPSGSFHHVVAPYVVSVVPEPERVMLEMARVCRPGGTVMVVNHFRSQGLVLPALERLLTPASQWIGFRLDLPLEAVTVTQGLNLERIERVNILGFWRLLEFRRLS